MSAGTSRTVSPLCWATPATMYRSVGKSSAQQTSTSRPGRASHPATSSLYRSIEVESLISTSPGRAPSTPAASASPTRPAWDTQPDQEPTSPVPHSCSATRASAAGVARGSRPRELPSR